jgi:orotate phosphoribosyltransferase
MEEQDVLTFVKNGRVFELTPGDFEGRRMTISEVVAIFGAFDAFWQYGGEPDVANPHALLKSGRHSNGFIMCKAVLEYPRLCMLLAHEMLKAMQEKMRTGEICQIDCVASSAYSAINVGWCLAWLLSEKYNKKAKHVTVEKDDKGNPTTIRGGLAPSLTVLVINELMTTGGGSTWETKEAVLKCNGDKPSPAIKDLSFVLMHRSRDFQLKDGSTVVPVFHFDMEDFEPEDCPYCKAGSVAIKPKVGNNWNLLHGEE